MRSLFAFGAAAALLAATWQPDGAEPVVRTIMAHAVELSHALNDGASGEVRVDYGSLVAMTTAAARREVGVAEIHTFTGELFVPGSRAEVIRCAPNYVQCVLDGGGIFVELLDFRLDDGGTLTVTVSYSHPVERRSGAVGVCSKWERFTFQRVSSIWTHQGTQTVRRC